ncbi:xanthine dehydrogenase family protein molybdopterin-binding subunit [Aliishimia ponticola]|uniref:Xanthine dehydrogenase family protein molybdopterin-binding subunit n=1 Tax=Aliishimia ponticola TaxID=2499833 RepID=A0A4S4NGR2_9RHOB|nr:xanthine dehydrogenase family protein molybdopterin-binding subunit [Aliishimia ponticola]THH37358.1 xanthine dehydrogenase family protein molybdopterin-binding subunit [Aliishimia ponticola]
MEKFGKSQPVKRIEDTRFLTGAGRYIDDIAPEGALYAVFVRSDVAHGDITTLDVSAAREAPGVKLVLTQADLEAQMVTATMDFAVQTNRDGSKGAAPARPVLAKDKVRHVGEALAVIIADSVVAGRDAAELVEVEIDDLPAKMDTAAGGAVLHAEAPDNRVFDWGLGDEAATKAAFDKAAQVVSLEVEDNRIMVNSLEPRGAWAQIEDGRLHLSFNGQGVWGAKAQLAAKFGLDPSDVRVTNPDVGGGFGMKSFMYPEYFCVAAAAKALGTPVRWMSERGEAMLSDNGGRDLVSVAELAFDDTNKITAYRIHSRCNMGAHCSQYAQMIQTQLFSRVLTNVYDIQTTWMQAEGFFTNTAPVDAYRGAGRPEAIYVMERLMDRAARELGVDPFELRMRNFIPAEAFPYDTPVGETYDVGDFHKVITRAKAEADLAGFKARHAADAAQGHVRGVGVCYYIESILGDPSETTALEFNEDGTVTIFVGTQSNGQGHETVFTQFLADQTGIPAEKIRFVQGDSDRIARGGGTGGSRSVTVQNNATLATVSTMTSAFTAFLSDETGVPAEQISFDDETFRISGSNLTPTMLDVADMAREKGRDDLLRHEETAKLDARSFPNGCHIAEVVISRDTGEVHLDRYTVVDDFGNLINPMLAEGQVHGGVAQGVGQALTEHVVFDEDGQLLTASFMDYALPRASDLPMFSFTSEPVPSTANIMGMKGCGEAGTVGAMAATANAVQDALWECGVRQADMPFTPLRVWEMMENARIAAE